MSEEGQAGGTGQRAGAPAPPADSAFESWDQRLELIARIAPYVLLAASLGLGLAGEPGKRAWLTAVLAVAAAAWIGWWVTFHPGWRQRQGLMVVYLLGLIALAALLLTRSLWFAFFCFTVGCTGSGCSAASGATPG